MVHIWVIVCTNVLHLFHVTVRVATTWFDWHAIFEPTANGL